MLDSRSILSKVLSTKVAFVSSRRVLHEAQVLYANGAILLRILESRLSNCALSFRWLMDYFGPRELEHLQLWPSKQKTSTNEWSNSEWFDSFFMLKASATTFAFPGWRITTILNAFNLGGDNVDSLGCQEPLRQKTWSDEDLCARATGAAPGIKSIWNSTWRTGGRLVVSSVIGGILSIEARDIDTKLLSAPESNNALAKLPFLPGVWTTLLILEARIASRWLAFVSVVFGKASNKSVFSGVGRLSSEEFYAFYSATSGWAYVFHQDKASSVKVPVANVTLFSSAQLLRENTDSVRSNQRMGPIAPSVPLKYKVFAIATACASRAVATLSATSCLMAA
ncbi:hypothetical protein Tco_0180941 [Tanacetum coccineum]